MREFIVTPAATKCRSYGSIGRLARQIPLRMTDSLFQVTGEHAVAFRMNQTFGRRSDHASHLMPRRRLRFSRAHWNRAGHTIRPTRTADPAARLHESALRMGRPADFVPAPDARALVAR